MTFNETAVIVIGLAAGYWLIDYLMNRTSRQPQHNESVESMQSDEERYKRYVAENCYSILGIAERATVEQISAAYQRLMEELLAEKSGSGDPEFQRLSEFKRRQLKDAYDYALASALKHDQ